MQSHEENTQFYKVPNNTKLNPTEFDMFSSGNSHRGAVGLRVPEGAGAKGGGGSGVFLHGVGVTLVIWQELELLGNIKLLLPHAGQSSFLNNGMQN